MSSISNLVNDDDLLRYAIKNGIIDTQRIRDEIEMKKRRDILSQHPYNILQNKKSGRWYTRFEDDSGNIYQKSRKTKEEIEELVIEYYTDGSTTKEPSVYTFEKAHDRWLEMQEEYGRSSNSIRRYETDWNRFFSESEFAKCDLLTITSRQIELFMINNIKQFNLKKRGGDGLYACISGVFYNAVMDGIVPHDKNPCLLVDKKKFDRFYNTDDKTVEERTLSPSEMTALINRVDSDILARPDYIYPYGIKLAILTGMRVGELAGLRWKHVGDNVITICESEKYDIVKNNFYQSKTKNRKTRTVPITDELRKFLDMMRELQEQYGTIGDFVLSFGSGKANVKLLTAYMNHKNDQLKFSSHKSIYSIRRTFNSYLRFGGVSATEAGSIIGNTPKVNDCHYTYDIQDIERKKEYVTNAEKKMLGIA